tara:strand:- start:349 stop:1665 length:1317 start_codon:yes stop_codon:yes gene_type:complete
MKLFKKLLAAQAALSIISPLAINATEIKSGSISDYAPKYDYQTFDDLSDIHPSDWTFQALVDIRNSRRCNVALPTGVITRTEAAALLNKCISDASKLTDAELRLVDEFSSEIAILRGNSEITDSLSFEAGQFSTTTTLSGYSNMLIGAVDGQPGVQHLNSFYGYGLDLNTSFSGEDLLYAGLAQGNFDSVSSELSGMDFSDTADTLTVESLFYSFPLAGLSITAGPLLDQDDVVSVTTSNYSDAWKLGGNPYTLPGSTGTGLAISKVLDNGINFTASYIGTEGSSAAGLGTRESEDILTAMVGFDSQDGFGGGLIYSKLGEGDASTTGYDAIGGGLYYKNDLLSIGFSYDSKDSEGSSENLEAWLIGTDINFGPGTLSAAISNVPDADVNDDDETQYELYYSYPVSDYITVTPGVFYIEGDGSAEDKTGVAVNTTFSF